MATANVATDMQIRLNRVLTQEVSINLVGEGTANYGVGTGEIIPANLTALCSSSPCEIRILTGITVVRVQAQIIGTSNQTSIASIQIPQGSRSFVGLGTPIMH